MPATMSKDPMLPSFHLPREVSSMDPEADKVLHELGDKSFHLFKDFMTRTAKFDELVDVGQHFLSCFCQELDMFRRPQLQKTISVVDSVLETNNTERVKAYVEAGFKHPHVAVQNIINLHSCVQGLQDYLKKVTILYDELERLKRDAITISQEINQTVSLLLDKYHSDDKGHEENSSDEEEIEPIHIQDNSLVYVSMMAAILDMLKSDYEMQVNIIKSLNLNTSLSELESYRLMWDLRPYINDNVIRQAWNFIP